MRSGGASSERVSISRDLLMSQFWQKRQARLQPAVPKESTGVPGRKWSRGFFSIGSTQKPLERPKLVSTISPPSQARTKQRPALALGEAAGARADVAAHLARRETGPVARGDAARGHG